MFELTCIPFEVGTTSSTPKVGRASINAAEAPFARLPLPDDEFHGSLSLAGSDSIVDAVLKMGVGLSGVSTSGISVKGKIFCDMPVLSMPTRAQLLSDYDQRMYLDTIEVRISFQ